MPWIIIKSRWSGLEKAGQQQDRHPLSPALWKLTSLISCPEEGSGRARQVLGSGLLSAPPSQLGIDTGCSMASEVRHLEEKQDR